MPNWPTNPWTTSGLRDYQEKAIRAVSRPPSTQAQTKLLVAMATGTGKTRLAIGLIYRLIKSKRFRRILFVVDRNALGEQAGDKFKETRLEELKTFDQIYDLKEVDASRHRAHHQGPDRHGSEPDARHHVSVRSR